MVTLDGSSLTLEQLTRIADDFEEVALLSSAAVRVDRARAVVQHKASDRKSVV